MITYISMLRGINVSGQKKIKMNHLKAVYQSLGFADVTTYIQSGNVVFSAEKTKESQLQHSIEQVLQEEYDFYVPVLIRTRSQITAVVDNVPEEHRGDPKRLYVTFLQAAPKTKLAVDDYIGPNEHCYMQGREIYLYCPDGYGKSKLSNTFFEKQLKVTATTRNWNTVTKLQQLAQVSPDIS